MESTTEAEAGYQQKVAALEKRLAATEARLQTAKARPEPGTWRKGSKGTVPVVAAPAPLAAPALVAAAPATPVPATEAPKWTVLGMTATTVVVSTANHRVVALAAGESLDGVKVERIDVAAGMAETSAGPLTYGH